MKKVSILFVFAFFLLAGTTTYAQEEIKEVKKEMQAEKAEIAVSDLPESIQKTLKESFADYAVKKAYKTKGASGETIFYAKVEKDGKWLKIALDESGKVVKKKEIEAKPKSS